MNVQPSYEKLNPDDRMLFEERAAIMEFEGGMTRTEAEYKAYMEIMRERIRRIEARKEKHGK